MPRRHTLPLLWLLSDMRNDAALENALHGLPEGSALVFRHYHLDEAARRARFDALSATAQGAGHLVVLSDRHDIAAAWGAGGVYGPVDRLGPPGPLLRLATAHGGDELQAANAAMVDGIFLSPVFPTRSHPDAQVLGVHGFHVLAMQSAVPVIALGGMNVERARELDWPRWGAVDGLV